MQSQAFRKLSYGQTRYVSFESVGRNRVHRHSYYEPCIVISGTGEFEHGSEVYALGKGDLFIADRGVYHEIRSVETRNLRIFFLSFHIVMGSDERSSSGQIPLPGKLVADFLHHHRTHVPGQAHLIPLFEHVTKLVRRNSNYRRNKNFHDGTLLLLRQIISAAAYSASMSDEAYDNHLQKSRIEELIEDRLHESLLVTDLARACGMSERTLRRRWKDWSERSLPEEITYRRMERACHLLLLPDIAVAEVGYQVGILSPAQFSRQFKETKGVTPRDYRKQIREGLLSGLSGENPHMTEYFEATPTR